MYGWCSCLHRKFRNGAWRPRAAFQDRVLSFEDRIIYIDVIMFSSDEYGASECVQWCTWSIKLFFLKGTKHTKPKMAACLPENSRWPLFVKHCMSIPIHKCIDRPNALIIGRDAIFLKIFVIPGGIRPHKIQLGGYICHPSKSKSKVPWNNLHILAKLLHAV